IGWIITFAGSAAAGRTGVNWFYIIFELFLILGIAAAIATNSIKYYRFSILTFLGASLVFIVALVNEKINSDLAEDQAVAAGAIFLSLVTFVWIFSFGSEEGSIVVSSINSLAINKVDRNTTQAVHGFAQSGPISPGIAMVPTSIQEPSINNTVVVTPNPDYAYKAKALYDCKFIFIRSKMMDEIDHLGFKRNIFTNIMRNKPGEILDIADNKGKWWQAKKTDGSMGIAPSNYLQII
ncbi:8436_t:CDS:2, partial [Funneliformis mosseae]